MSDKCIIYFCDRKARCSDLLICDYHLDIHREITRKERGG
jgi:hypothetical protein